MVNGPSPNSQLRPPDQGLQDELYVPRVAAGLLPDGMSQDDFADGYRTLFGLINELTGESDAGSYSLLHRTARFEVFDNPACLPLLIFSAEAARHRQKNPVEARSPGDSNAKFSTGEIELLEHAEKTVIPRAHTVMRLLTLKKDLTPEAALDAVLSSTAEHSAETSPKVRRVASKSGSATVHVNFDRRS